jgi:hypothetical protein
VQHLVAFLPGVGRSDDERVSLLGDLEEEGRTRASASGASGGEPGLRELEPARRVPERNSGMKDVA